MTDSTELISELRKLADSKMSPSGHSKMFRQAAERIEILEEDAILDRSFPSASRPLKAELRRYMECLEKITLLISVALGDTSNDVPQE